MMLLRTGVYATTVSATVVECDKLPSTPVIVTVDAPTAAADVAVKVTTLEPVVGFVPKAAVTPVGRPDALRVTAALNPLIGATVTVLVLVEP